jgi:hypothetical protein
MFRYCVLVPKKRRTSNRLEGVPCEENDSQLGVRCFKYDKFVCYELAEMQHICYYCVKGSTCVCHVRSRGYANDVKEC